MDEKATRKQLIDKVLEVAGWSPIVRYAPGASYHTAAVEEYETAEGPADCVLFHRGEALAAVEAKKLGLGPQNVLVQAQRYARGFRGGAFNFHGFRLPFVYFTNGEVFWFQDLREPNSRSRQVARFHTPSALRDLALRLQKWQIDGPLLVFEFQWKDGYATSIVIRFQVSPPLVGGDSPC